MGVALAAARIIYLQSYQADLEYKIQLITQTKMSLSDTMNELQSVGTDMDSDSPEVKQLEQKREKLQLIEKQLDQQLAIYNQKLKMIEAEMQSAEQMFEKNVQRSFKYG